MIGNIIYTIIFIRTLRNAHLVKKNHSFLTRDAFFRIINTCFTITSQKKKYIYIFTNKHFKHNYI
jgi:hypothetical protein